MMLILLGLFCRFALGANDESYLDDNLDMILDYDKNPVAKQFINQQKWVKWMGGNIIEWFVPEEMELPMKKEFAVELPAKFEVAEGVLTVTKATITGLNTFEKLNTQRKKRFTWEESFACKDIDVKMDVEITDKAVAGGAPKIVGTVSYDMKNPIYKLKTPTCKYELIMAMDSVRMCEIYGPHMLDSPDCFLYGMFHDSTAGKTGFKFTNIGIDTSAKKLALKWSLEDAADQGTQVIDEDWTAADWSIHEEAIKALLSEILGNVRDNINEDIEDTITSNNCEFAKDLPGRGTDESPDALTTSKKPPFAGKRGTDILDASEVCVVNNGGYALHMAWSQCANGIWSPKEASFPADVMKCQSIAATSRGAIFRAGMKAKAGHFGVMDPTFRYTPKSNAVGLICSGSTTLPHCETLSLMPVEPTKAPEVQGVCVINHAGFVMYFAVKSHAGGSTRSSNRYSINHWRCIDLSTLPGIKEGDSYYVEVQAIGGARKVAGGHGRRSGNVTYKKNGLKAAWHCKGGTLDYECARLAKSQHALEDVKSRPALEKLIHAQSA